MKKVVLLITIMIVPVLLAAQTADPEDVLGKYHFQINGRLTTLIITQGEDCLNAMLAKGPTFPLKSAGEELKYVPQDSDRKMELEFYKADSSWKCKMILDGKEYVGDKVSS